MVCLGNICRSPLAEGIMRYKASQKGIDIDLDSAGTSDFHVGEAPDPRTSSNALRHGIDLSNLRSRQLRCDDFENFDRIYAMDNSNYSDIVAVAPNARSAAKVELLLNAAFPGQQSEVPDPYYGGPDGFEKVFLMLDKACEVILAQINNGSR